MQEAVSFRSPGIEVCQAGSNDPNASGEPRPVPRGSRTSRPLSRRHAVRARYRSGTGRKTSASMRHLSSNTTACSGKATGCESARHGCNGQRSHRRRMLWTATAPGGFHAENSVGCPAALGRRRPVSKASCGLRAISRENNFGGRNTRFRDRRTSDESRGGQPHRGRGAGGLWVLPGTPPQHGYEESRFPAIYEPFLGALMMIIFGG